MGTQALSPGLAPDPAGLAWVQLPPSMGQSLRKPSVCRGAGTRSAPLPVGRAGEGAGGYRPWRLPEASGEGGGERPRVSLGTWLTHSISPKLSHFTEFKLMGPGAYSCHLGLRFRL